MSLFESAKQKRAGINPALFDTQTDLLYKLERKLQPKLDRAIPARTQHRVKRSAVRRSAAATESSRCGRIRRSADAVPVGSTVRVSENRVIENVEHFHAELRVQPFMEFEV